MKRLIDKSRPVFTVSSKLSNYDELLERTINNTIMRLDGSDWAGCLRYEIGSYRRRKKYIVAAQIPYRHINETEALFYLGKDGRLYARHINYSYLLRIYTQNGSTQSDARLDNGYGSSIDVSWGELIDAVSKLGIPDQQCC